MNEAQIKAAIAALDDAAKVKHTLLGQPAVTTSGIWGCSCEACKDSAEGSKR